MARERTRLVLSVWVFSLLAAILAVALYAPMVWGSGTIYIRADGSIDPPTAPISSLDNMTYTFVGDIFDSVVVERSNVVIDGNGYTLEGTGAQGSIGVDLTGRENVTVQHTQVKNFYWGILFLSSANSTAIGNKLTDNSYGVELRYSFNISVSGNNVTANFCGIWLRFSRYSNVIGNNMTANRASIMLESSNYNDLSGNNMTANGMYGIYVYGSSSNSIHGNILVGDGFIVTDSYSNYVVDNVVNGRPLVYLEGDSDLVVEDAGQVILVNCINITVRNLNLSRTAVGVELWQSSNSTITSNTLIENNMFGIWLNQNSNNNIVSRNNLTANKMMGIVLESSSNNTVEGNHETASGGIGIYLKDSSSYNKIAGNNVTNNYDGLFIQSETYSKCNAISRNNIMGNSEHGILFMGTSNNSIIGNTIAHNGYGIWLSWYGNLGPPSNTIYHNNFIENTQQIRLDSYDLDHPNAWDDGYPSGGNYWSAPFRLQDSDRDGISDNPYIIDKDNQDRYPLMYQWPDVTSPATVNDYDGLWHSTDFTVTLTAIDDKSDVKATYYAVNDGATRTVGVDGQPLITREGSDIKLEYWSIDNVGNEELPHKILTEIKLDKTAPTANAGTDRAVYEDTIVTFDASTSNDENGIATCTWTFTDTILQTLTGKNPSYTFNTPGVYTLTLNVTDTAGNWATDTMTATILDITRPVAEAGQDRTVNVGAAVAFDAGGSTDNVGIVNYEWNFGDGTTGTDKTMTHIYNTPGNYTIKLTVKDSAGNTASDSLSVTVQSTESSSSSETLLIMIGAAILVAGVAVCAVLLFRRRK